MRAPIIGAWLAVAGCSAPAQPSAAALLERPEVRAFIDEMARKHDFDARALSELFAALQPRADIIAKISRPAEKTKPWYAYRAIFLDEQRIDGGVAFWRAYQAILARAEQHYGVPAEVIVAIIGVETRYGQITGADGVLEALATLAFDYPPRADFFRAELEHYLLLTRAEGIDPLTLHGSYAGAMGLAQFMPSSYRAYAVDFDGDGRRDLWQNPADAIGSVANYLHEHRWQRGGPIALPAQVQGSQYQALLSKELTPRVTIAQWRRLGVLPALPVAAEQRAILLELEGTSGAEYWLGFANFYAITRYNRSPLYAMAVFQLSQEIRQRL
jgi:membrane-bound lytic murein transglycosylase B